MAEQNETLQVKENISKSERKFQNTKIVQLGKSLKESLRSGKINRRNLRERRKGTGIAISEEDNSPENSDDANETSSSLDVAKKIAQFNQIFSAQPLQLSDEDVLMINKKLQEEIILKDNYIQQLESKIRQLEKDLVQKM